MSSISNAACDGAASQLSVEDAAAEPQKRFVQKASKPQVEQKGKLFPGFVGVHVGAGQHSRARTERYLSICSEACLAAIEILRREEEGCAVDAAIAATAVLEDAGETNAGFGSNLTAERGIEMDASIMEGRKLAFGSVGAMPGIKNPIKVAGLLIKEQTRGLLPLGRVPPVFLVGDGATTWAVKHGMTAVSSRELVSEKATKIYNHFVRKLEMAKNETAQKKLKRSAKKDETLEGVAAMKKTKVEERVVAMEEDDDDDRVTDTVGVVVMDRKGNFASTVSSGGIAFKQPGRVGQASCFGCGCWSQNHAQPDAAGVCVSTTGCGEHLMRTMMAKSVAESLAQCSAHRISPIHAVKDAMMNKFAGSEFLLDVGEKLGGAICLYKPPGQPALDFLWSHTTASMGLAFQSTGDNFPTTKMSRLPPAGGTEDKTRSTTILVECVSINDNSNSTNE